MKKLSLAKVEIKDVFSDKQPYTTHFILGNAGEVDIIFTIYHRKC